MIQPEDKKTMTLPGIPEKRGRGRPRKEGAMTNAERQAAFRARRKAQGIPVTVTRKPVVVDGYDELVLENERLREELGEVRRAAEAARGGSVDSRATAVAFVEQGVISVIDALRESLPEESRHGRRRLTCMVDEATRLALRRLAADVGIAPNDALERLVYWADAAVLKSFVSDEEFNRYLDRKRNEKLA